MTPQNALSTGKHVKQRALSQLPTRPVQDGGRVGLPDAKATAAKAEPRPWAGEAQGAAPWRSTEVSFS